MRILSILALSLVLCACRCGPSVAKVEGAIGVSPTGLDFGKVKVGQPKQLTVKLESQSRTELVLSSFAIEGQSAAAYRLGTTPNQIEPLEASTITITFTPPSVAPHAATLVISSNDPERPKVRVALAGEGAMPQMEVTADCPTARGCIGTVVVDPPSIDFGMEPLVRLSPIEVTKLPTLVIVNTGAVELHVTAVSFQGADAAAFTIAGNTTFPVDGVTLDAAAGFNLPIRFVPSREAQTTYSAQVQITGDDPDKPSVIIALSGTLRPNQPPVVCANLIRVVPQLIGDAPRDYGSSTDWSPLLVPPSGGYDFTITRDVRPDELVVFSANSSTDVAACSADPEDGRMGLTYQWRLTEAPAGALGLAIASATTPQAQLRPVLTGRYTMELAVTDSRLSTTTVSMRFVVIHKQDLVAQLQWPGFEGVDLDVHLIRPSAAVGADPFSGAFSFFNGGTSGKTAGDINGFAKRTKDNNAGAGYDFDWGLAGAADDPVLNLDDRGDGRLVENVSLNFPENDAECATASCTYRVMVHSFNDGRAHVAPPACSVDGGVQSSDGDAAGCGTNLRCVADSAPVGALPLGAGKCYPAPKPVVRVFLKGDPTPAAVIPVEGLSPPDEVLLGAPCQLWHAADIAWPAKTAIGSLPDGGTPAPVVTIVGADVSGRITSPSMARFGRRQAGGSLQCSPDSTQGSVDWYSRQP